MSGKLKRELAAMFDAPEPARKKGFMSSINYPKTTRLDFIISQAGYIRKRVWAAALVALAPVTAFALAPGIGDALGTVWVISSMLPFVALAGLTEIARSSSFNMSEIEMSCKHSLNDVILARLGIIGAADMVVFVLIAVLLQASGDFDGLRMVFYLFVPYLLTCSLSLFAINRSQQKEAVYVCGGVSCAVSILNALVATRIEALFNDKYNALWAASFALLLIWTAAETYKLIRRTEKRQWNLT